MQHHGQLKRGANQDGRDGQNEPIRSTECGKRDY
jgi:hypothetical protein